MFLLHIKRKITLETFLLQLKKNKKKSLLEFGDLQLRILPLCCDIFLYNDISPELTE